MIIIELFKKYCSHFFDCRMIIEESFLYHRIFIRIFYHVSYRIFTFCFGVVVGCKLWKLKAGIQFLDEEKIHIDILQSCWWNKGVFSYKSINKYQILPEKKFWKLLFIYNNFVQFADNIWSSKNSNFKSDKGLRNTKAL